MADPLERGVLASTRGLLSGRFLLVAGAVAIAFFALLPVIGLLGEGLSGVSNGNAVQLLAGCDSALVSQARGGVRTVSLTFNMSSAPSNVGRDL